jgi:hypothetical protein
VTDYQKININFIKTIATERVSNFSEKKKKKKKEKKPAPPGKRSKTNCSHHIYCSDGSRHTLGVIKDNCHQSCCKNTLFTGVAS